MVKRKHAGRATILDLADDTLIGILSTLALVDVAAAAVTCRTWSRLLRQSRARDILAASLLGCSIESWRAMPQTNKLIVTMKRAWVIQNMDAITSFWYLDESWQPASVTGASITFTPTVLRIGWSDQCGGEYEFDFGSESVADRTVVVNKTRKRTISMLHQACEFCEGVHPLTRIFLHKRFFDHDVMPRSDKDYLSGLWKPLCFFKSMFDGQ